MRKTGVSILFVVALLLAGCASNRDFQGQLEEPISTSVLMAMSKAELQKRASALECKEGAIPGVPGELCAVKGWLDPQVPAIILIGYGYATDPMMLGYVFDSQHIAYVEQTIARDLGPGSAQSNAALPAGKAWRSERWTILLAQAKAVPANDFCSDCAMLAYNRNPQMLKSEPYASMPVTGRVQADEAFEPLRAANEHTFQPKKLIVDGKPATVIKRSDFVALLKKMFSTQKPKDGYESATERAARVQSYIGRRYALHLETREPIQVADLMVIGCQYAPDIGSLSLTTYITGDGGVLIQRNSTSKGTDLRQNHYGAKVNVALIDVEVFKLNFQNVARKRGEYGGMKIAHLDVSPQAARDLVPNLWTEVIFEIAANPKDGLPIKMSSSIGEATLDKPEERLGSHYQLDATLVGLRVYDKRDGRTIWQGGPEDVSSQ